MLFSMNIEGEWTWKLFEYCTICITNKCNITKNGSSNWNKMLYNFLVTTYLSCKWLLMPMIRKCFKSFKVISLINCAREFRELSVMSNPFICNPFCTLLNKKQCQSNQLIDIKKLTLLCYQALIKINIARIAYV